MVTLDEEFARWWAVWPKKVSKAAAKDAFRWAMQHFNDDGRLVDRMIATTAWQVAFYGSPKYLKDPDKWLLGQRWDDEEPAPETVEPTAAERRGYTQWVHAVGPFVARDWTLTDWVKRQRGVA